MSRLSQRQALRTGVAPGCVTLWSRGLARERLYPGGRSPVRDPGAISDYDVAIRRDAVPADGKSLPPLRYRTTNPQTLEEVVS